MNKRTVRHFWDLLLAGVLALLLFFLSTDKLINLAGVNLMVALIPLMWLALRHGAPSAIIAASLVGLIQGAVHEGFNDWLGIISHWIAPLLSVGLMGLFAKYTQKTLNNKRYSSTYLNIFTGSLLVLMLYSILDQVLFPIALGQSIAFDFANLTHWLSLLLSWLVSAGLLSLIARFAPQVIIPKRSKYLSRKETSSLLND